MSLKYGRHQRNDSLYDRLKPNKYVFATTDRKTFRLLAVGTGAMTGGYTEIKTELPQGEQVIKSAYTLLTMLKNRSEE